MTEEYPVYPNLQKNVKIVKFKYNVLEIKLFEFVRIVVYLYNENDALIEARQYLIKDDEYNSWSNDDKYIINLLKKKIQEQ